MQALKLKSFMPNGIFPVYKPKGITSHDAVQKIKTVIWKTLGPNAVRSQFIKVGHGGTLDPMAEGVLVIGVGDGTKELEKQLKRSNKRYNGVALLGFETDTLDSTGKTTITKDCSHITNDKIDNTLQKFRGKIQQMPPMYSAIKKNGVKLYTLARKGVSIEREYRDAEIFELQLVHGNVVLPSFELTVECSSGLYVRSLIEDIGRSIDGAAHMTSLVRTKQGPFTLANCLHESDWKVDKILTCIEESKMKMYLSPS